VVLRVNSAEDLLAITVQATAAELPSQLVEDAGRTQLAPGTPTCCAVGPAAAERIDTVTGELSLL
jgi:PTH2 family peptidyl-tRNA hydrolase